MCTKSLQVTGFGNFPLKRIEDKETNKIWHVQGEPTAHRICVLFGMESRQILGLNQVSQRGGATRSRIMQTSAASCRTLLRRRRSVSERAEQNRGARRLTIVRLGGTERVEGLKSRLIRASAMAVAGAAAGRYIAALTPRTAPSLSFPGSVSQRGAAFPEPSSSYRKQRSSPSSITCLRTESEPKVAKERSFLDNASNLLTNLLSGGNLGSMPTAEGAVSDLFGRPLFFALYDWFIQHGSVYKLAFGPKAFVVVSDPIVARHILRENAFGYDKGVLADILEPIMGKGLIPADLETWKPRRRAIVPGFHSAYLEAMVEVFNHCTERTVNKLETLLQRAESTGDGLLEVEMEAEYSNLALDIIGLSVFNYDFGSVTSESPVIQAVYGTLYEAEHRSTFYIPYWKFPPARWLVPRQVKFKADLKVINDCLDELIRRARETRQEDDVEAMQQRDYSKVKDKSLLRFLVDMRGEEPDDRQLRDDLMTMLIAGHETTAAVLTWATFMLAQNPDKIKRSQDEIDSVLGGRKPTFEDLKKLQYVRLIVAEALRLYPQPPLLIRRSLRPDKLPGGHKGDPNGYPIPRGVDLFISVYNLHRSPYFWDEPEKFMPERFLRAKSSEVAGWAGFDPERGQGALYPNEVMADFAFLPFGGGPRKCVGDQFALMESAIGLAMLLQKFDVQLKGTPEDVELVTGATIHTKAGLWCKLKRRQNVQSALAPEVASVGS